MPTPKKRRCECGAKLEEYEPEFCPKCMRLVCACGRRFPYAGRGRPASRCPKCAELRPDYRVCGGCGTVLPSSRRRWCGAVCAREAHRIQRGGQPRGKWMTHIASALDGHDAHEKAATVVALWLWRYEDMDVFPDGMSVVVRKARARLEVRQSDMHFRRASDLPEWVPIDDMLRLDTLRTMVPPLTGTLVGYALANANLDAVAMTNANVWDVVHWRKRRCWIPRYCDYDVELSAPSSRCQVFSLQGKAAAR